MYISILFFRKQATHTHTHTQRAPWDVINFLLLWSSALLSVLVLIFLLLSFSVQFLFREVLLPHCRFKGYNAIKIPNTYLLLERSSAKLLVFYASTRSRRAVEVIICMITRDFSVISIDVTGVSLSLSTTHKSHSRTI